MTRALHVAEVHGHSYPVLRGGKASLLFSTEVLGHLITGPLPAAPEGSQIRAVKSPWGIKKGRINPLNMYAFVSWQL